MQLKLCDNRYYMRGIRTKNFVLKALEKYRSCLLICRPNLLIAASNSERRSVFDVYCLETRWLNESVRSLNAANALSPSVVTRVVTLSYIRSTIKLLLVDTAVS